MAKYLVCACYTTDGVKGLMKDGGSKRRAAVEQTARSVGAKIEAFYFAFGDHDVYIVVDAPDNASAAAISLVVSESGAVRTKTVVLLTPDEVDQATKKSVEYRPPGSR